MRSTGFAVALMCSAALLGGASLAWAEAAVSAKVNGVEISQVRVDSTFGAFLESQRVQAAQLRNPQQYQQLRRQVLDSLIGQELLFQEAKKRGFKAPDEEVKKALDQAQAGSASKEAYQQRLAQAGFTEEGYAEDTRKRLTVAEMLEKDISAKVVVTDVEIEEFYKANPAAFTPPEQVHVRHILITVPADADAATKEAAKKRLEGIAAEIKGGADFAELAKKSSQDSSAEEGGDLGVIGRGQTVKPFEDAAFALKVGEVSGVVETQYGYHLIKLEERQGGQEVPLDSVKDRVRQFLTARKTQDELQALVAQLRKAADVQVRE
jgi:peptidyl-prolyl cis-trans isomerase C